VPLGVQHEVSRSGMSVPKNKLYTPFGRKETGEGRGHWARITLPSHLSMLQATQEDSQMLISRSTNVINLLINI
jgi:hypothetical protein